MNITIFQLLFVLFTSVMAASDDSESNYCTAFVRCTCLAEKGTYAANLDGRISRGMGKFKAAHADDVIFDTTKYNETVFELKDEIPKSWRKGATIHLFINNVRPAITQPLNLMTGYRRYYPHYPEDNYEQTYLCHASNAEARVTPYCPPNDRIAVIASGYTCF